MSFNGTGTFTLPSGNPVVTGTTISSTWANNTLSDIASNGLTNCITKDGQTTITANIPFGSNRITGLGAGTAATDAARVSQVQAGGLNMLTGVAGTNTVTGSLTPAPSAYAEGLIVSWIPLNTNTGQATLNVSSLGAVPLFLDGATATSSVMRAQVPLSAIYVSTSSATGFHIVASSGFLPRSAYIPIAIGTPATASGVAVDFSGFPAGTARIVISVNNLSTNGTSNLAVQIGDAGGIETTAYVSESSTDAATRATSTGAFLITAIRTAADAVEGAITLTLLDAANNTWVATHIMSNATQVLGFGAGHKSLSAALDRVRITTEGGTDAFDLGLINVQSTIYTP